MADREPRPTKSGLKEIALIIRNGSRADAGQG